MGHVIVTGFVSLDGIVTDPDGSGGTPTGGWAFRHGPETVGGDKFRLGELMDSGVLLLGRTTWELFSRLWPNRTDDFSLRMNKMAKVVASHSLTDLSAFPNSTLMEGSLTDYVRTESRTIAVTGSLSVIRALQAADLVDEYRLMTFPSVVGTGEKLFGPSDAPVHFQLASVVQTGAASLATYVRP
ncbi:dihydrofolate reductase family protein [Kribbella sp. VKM Ac-2566]|uniref:dihydrofolate reductase family protein n=1 Tax=Kribbella sp. VKM Ac-2566 TaxID=2512218 RepID=UPI001062889B|nr:dihydrofolate reductase family protein [Kribbella sp. VKM Ac-2566]TDX03515.1 dihydrofolate reductase [Kribbella sp. VKM Ac-2566]